MSKATTRFELITSAESAAAATRASTPRLAVDQAKLKIFTDAGNDPLDWEQWSNIFENRRQEYIGAATQDTPGVTASKAAAAKAKAAA